MSTKTQTPAAQLIGPRVILRRYRQEDAEPLYRLFHENHERFVESFPKSIGSITSLENAATNIVDKNRTWDEGTDFYYGVWDSASGASVGQVQLKHVDWTIPTGELGYLVDARFEGQGFASEALRRLLHEAFERLAFNRLYMRIIPRNARSTRVATRLGFRDEGIHEHAFRTGHGELREVHLFGMNRDDYQALRGST